MRGDGEAAGIEAIHGTVAGAEGGAPRMLDVVVQEDAALPVESAVRAVDEVVGGVVGVGGTDAVDEHFAVVGDVVTIGVFQEDDVGL